MRRKGERAVQVCPFWHQLATDVLCMYPQTGYCLGAEHGKPRFPSRASVRQFCIANFGVCEGFQQRATQAR